MLRLSTYLHMHVVCVNPHTQMHTPAKTRMCSHRAYTRQLRKFKFRISKLIAVEVDKTLSLPIPYSHLLVNQKATICIV